jgi:DNA-binding NarL/FixJ family response regulator
LSKRPRVLVAEDHVAVAKAVCRLLALDFDIVGTVSDGSAALEAVTRLQPDVMVLDLNLPRINGLEVCRQVSQEHPATKVVVFTAMNEPDIRKRAFEVGAAGYVCKTAGTDDLLATLRQVSAEKK